MAHPHFNHSTIIETSQLLTIQVALNLTDNDSHSHLHSGLYKCMLMCGIKLWGGGWGFLCSVRADCPIGINLFY